MAVGLNSISGIFSGIDSASLVDKIMQFERRPAYLLEASKAREELTLAGFGALEAALANLRGAVEGLRRPSDFRRMQVSSSQAELLSATASKGAAAGVYNLRIQQLAQSHQVVSGGFADAETSLGSGTVTISLGNESFTVTLTQGNDSLQDLATAINQAAGGVTAMVVNTGEGASPYQIILSGNETGAAQTIGVSTALTGGTGIGFGTVAGVVIESQSGSSSVASGGHFTGDTDAVYSFSVNQGGVVGSDTILIDWTNDEGDSGQITLDADYAGGPVVVEGSLALSFGAGDLQAGDAWNVSAVSSTIQAAQDALVSFGTTLPITIASASNTVSNLINGVTLNLLGADVDQTITVKVEQDVEGLMTSLQGFVDKYNGAVDFLLEQFAYNPDTEDAGVLLGDRTAMRLDSQIRGDVMRAVAGLGSEFTQLAQIGIGTSVGESLDVDGKLSIDEDTLRAAIQDDLEGVIALLGSTGTSSDEDVVFLSAGLGVVPTGAQSGYSVVITQAATQGSYTGGGITAPSGGSPFVIGAGNNQLRLEVDGVDGSAITVPSGSYTSGEALAAAIQSAVNADEALGGKSVGVSWEELGGGEGRLVITSRSWGGNSKVSLGSADGSLAADLGLDAGSPITGRDVAGHFLVGGEVQEATGSGRILTGNAEDGETDGLSVQVNLTEATLLAQGEAQGSVRVWSGVTDRLFRTLDGALDTVDGILTIKQQSLRDTITDYEKQVKEIDDRLAKRKERYLREFQRMESLLAEMSAQSSSFSSMLSNVSSGYGGGGASNA